MTEKKSGNIATPAEALAKAFVIEEKAESLTPYEKEPKTQRP